MVTREDGFVAIQHYNSNPKSVQVGNTVYNFTPQHNVSLVWADPKDVNSLLSMRASVCCGKTKPLCFPASQINVNLWTTGNRD